MYVNADKNPLTGVVYEMKKMSSKDDIDPTADTDTDCNEPEKPINISLQRDTHARVTAYKHLTAHKRPRISKMRRSTRRKTFDEAVNELLDSVGFPEADAFENPEFPILPDTDDQTFLTPADDRTD